MPQRRDALSDEFHHTLGKIGIIQPNRQEQVIDGFKTLQAELLQQFPAGGININLDLLKQRMLEAEESVKAADFGRYNNKLNPSFPPFPTLRISNDRFDFLFAHPDHQLFRDYPDWKVPDLVKEGISILGDELRLIQKKSFYGLPLIIPIRDQRIKPTHSSEERFIAMFSLWSLDPK